MLRILDARTGEPVPAAPARRGLTRIEAHASGLDPTALRVLLTADLLVRALELSGTPVWTILTAPHRAAELRTAAATLSIRPFEDARDLASGLGEAQAIQVTADETTARGDGPVMLVAPVEWAGPVPGEPGAGPCAPGGADSPSGGVASGEVASGGVASGGVASGGVADEVGGARSARSGAARGGGPESGGEGSGAASRAEPAPRPSPAEAPGPASWRASESAPGSTPGDAPESASGRAPGWASERAPEPAFGGASESVSGRITESAPAHAPVPPAHPPLDALLADPAALRLALLAVPRSEPVRLDSAVLQEAARWLAGWRRDVAGWARRPSRPVPDEVRARLRSAWEDDLDLPGVLDALRDVASAPDLPDGARFETYVYADRLLALDLARDLGSLG